MLVSKRARNAACGLVALAAAACSGSSESRLHEGDGGDTTGLGAGTDLGFSQGDGSNANGSCGTALTGRLRDFRVDHPDFEYVIADEHGIVAPELGADQKPVYLGGQGITTTGKANFDQWYRDTPGVNLPLELTINLTAGANGIYTYDNQAFFPIDGQLWGNEGNPHNYHFTYELHTVFRYAGGEVFSFTGDDDLYVFINGRLAIDLGGVHAAENGKVKLDKRAAQLGLTPGKSYPLDLFFAERHTVDSHFRVDTTINFTGCGTPALK